MILIVTVVLTNNDKIVFELGESLYSSRVLLSDENGRRIDETQIMRENDSHIYTFGSGLEEFRASHLPGSISNSDKFDTHIIPYAEEINICGFSIFKVEKRILESSRMVSYFLKTDEISELVNRSEFINGIIDNKKDLLFLYPDFTSSDAYEKEIQSINVEWRSRFSNELKDKIDMIERK